ncbi:MAG: hypothetical protein ACE5I1_24780 [bacterium]
MQSNLTEAIAYYHSLALADEKIADAEFEALQQKQVDRRITFGGRPLANTLRPAFLTEAMYNYIQDTVYTIRQAVLKLAATYFDKPECLDLLGLTEVERELASIPTKVIRLAATARMDAFMTANSFKFVEINAESPAGPAYVHNLAKTFREGRFFKEFEKKYPVRFVSPLEHLVAGMLRIYHDEFDGKEEKPAFCIVDFPNVPTFNEFELTKEYLERFGCTCEIADPRQLECKDGWIYANGRKIDILYRRLLISEFLPIKEECKAYFTGYKEQKTCFLNTFRAKLVHKKAVFNFLTDETYNHILTNREREAIFDHIPWTRRLLDQRTTFRGLAIDLLEFIRANRNYFVIKPNDEYGGKDVFLGFSLAQNEWDAAIENGVKNGFVVQEIVDIHREPFIYKIDGAWQEVPTILDLDPYLNGPLMGGCLARISTTNLANVTAGAGTVPQFILRYL